VYLPDRATYVPVPGYHVSAALLMWALLAGPLIGFGAAAHRLVVPPAVTGPASLFAALVAFGSLGVIGIAYPQLLGNGKDMAHDVFLGGGTLGLLLVLTVLTPAGTALCLSSGASGGLFTPVTSTGAVLGGGTLGFLLVLAVLTPAGTARWAFCWYSRCSRRQGPRCASRAEHPADCSPQSRAPAPSSVAASACSGRLCGQAHPFRRTRWSAPRR